MASWQDPKLIWHHILPFIDTKPTIIPGKSSFDISIVKDSCRDMEEMGMHQRLRRAFLGILLLIAMSGAQALVAPNLPGEHVQQPHMAAPMVSDEQSSRRQPAMAEDMTGHRLHDCDHSEGQCQYYCLCAIPVTANMLREQATPNDYYAAYKMPPLTGELRSLFRPPMRWWL